MRRTASGSTIGSCATRSSSRPWTLCAGSRSAADELLRIDLRLLEPAGIVNVDRLPVRELLERGRAGFPRVRWARLLRPPERKLNFGSNRRRIHIRDPGLEVVHGTESPSEVVRVNA